MGLCYTPKKAIGVLAVYGYLLRASFVHPLASLVSVDLTQQRSAQNSAQTQQSIQHRASTQQLTILSSVLHTLLHCVVLLRHFGTEQEGSEV